MVLVIESLIRWQCIFWNNNHDSKFLRGSASHNAVLYSIVEKTLVKAWFTVSSTLVLSRKWVSGLPFQLSPYNAITRGMSSKVYEWMGTKTIHLTEHGVSRELPPHSIILPLSYNFMLMSSKQLFKRSALLNAMFLNKIYKPNFQAVSSCIVPMSNA